MIKMNSKTVFIFLLIFLTIPVVYAESYGSGSYGSGSYGSEETVADSGNGGSSGHQLSNIVPSAPSSEGRAPARPSRRSPTPKESVLFDVMGKIIETDELLKQGTQEISFEVDLLKFGLSGESINAQVIYNIFDVEGNLIHSETENVGVETQMNFIKTLTLSEELIEGKYSVKIEVLYDGKTAESMMSFEVVEELLKEKSYFVYYLLLSVLLIIGMIIVLRKRLIFGKQLERKNHFEDSFTNVEQKSVSWIKPIVNDKITLSLKILILKLLDFIELVILVVISVYKKIKIKIEEEKEFLKKSFRGDLWK